MVKIVLDFYKVIVLLLFTLIGLFLAVVSFASFGVLTEIGAPIALINIAIEKLNNIQEHQDEKDAKDEVWKNLVINDHLFISSIIAYHDKQNSDYAKQLKLKTNKSNQLVINGTDIIQDNRTIPIPPSALKYFQSEKIKTSYLH